MMTRVRLVGIADDCGYDWRRDEGIMECYEKSGVISGGSLLVNGASAATFAKNTAARQHEAQEQSKPCSQASTSCSSLERNAPGRYTFYLGVHLNLTEGVPVTASREFHGLTVPEKAHNGKIKNVFRGKFGFRKAIKAGEIPHEEIMVELHAQIDRFIELYGYAPSHVDGHQHIHVIPEVRRCLVTVLMNYAWRDQVWVRIPELIPEELHYCETHQANTGSMFLRNVSNCASSSRAFYRDAGLCCPDYFMGCGLMGASMSVSAILDFLDQIARWERGKEEVIVEFMSHPGYASTSRGGCGSGPDEFSRSLEREHELDELIKLGEELEKIKRRLVRHVDRTVVDIVIDYFPRS